MGSNINEFIVKIDFDKNGEVREVRYWDQEGCGHERSIDYDDSVADMIQYHLRHYRQSHDQVPPRRCGFWIKTDMLPGIKGAVLQCVLEPHPVHVKHRLEVGS